MRKRWCSLGAVRCLALTALVAVIGCEGGGGGPDYSSHDFGSNDPNVIVAQGDSITLGYGLPSSESYPAQLSGMLGRPVINSGVGGENSEGGLSRVNAVLNRHKPGFLLLMYGSNDIIGGHSLQAAVENLRGMVRAAKANQTIPILATVPPGFTEHAYITPSVQALNPMIRQMASEEDVSVVNAYDALNDTSLFQEDGLHPTAEGARRLASAFGDKL